MVVEIVNSPNKKWYKHNQLPLIKKNFPLPPSGFSGSILVDRIIVTKSLTKPPVLTQ